MKNNKLLLTNQERVEEWMHLLSKESHEIRDEIADAFPAYNSLLNLHAKSFAEFALLPIARERGLSYTDALFDYRTITPPCPYCSNSNHIQHKGEFSYLCTKCNAKFAANTNSISSGFRLSSVVWRKVLQCMLDFCSIKRACDYCGISATTYYNIRTRIFYAMQLMMNDLKLYGNIQVDNTFAYLSFKGSELQTKEYPEDSPFGGLELAPRGARSRGGSYKHAEKHKNSVCIFAAIDDSGHVMVRLVGKGTATAKKLLATVGEKKFLRTIPEKDPFELIGDKSTQNNNKAGTASLIIADGERATQKFAGVIGISCESNVYRRSGRQLRLSSNVHDIQRVNSLHSRLKRYLRKINYVSSKYLPGFLTMFEFIENTRATDESIGRLFEILATPGLGKSASFYKNLFASPETDKNKALKLPPKDAVMEAKNSKGFTNKQLLAIYLYDAWTNGKIEPFTSNFLERCTGVSLEKAAKLHIEVIAKGQIDKIRALKTSFGEMKVVPPDILDFYDRLTEMRKRPRGEQVELKSFIEESNIAYQTNYSVAKIKRYIKLISMLGLRAPLHEARGRRISERELRDKYLFFYRERQKRYSERRANNEAITFKQIEEDLSREYGLSADEIKRLACKGRQLEKQKE